MDDNHHYNDYNHPKYVHEKIYIYIITIMMNIMKWTYYIHQNMIEYSWNDLQLYSCITGVGKVIQYFFRPLQGTHQMGQVPHEISCHILDNVVHMITYNIPIYWYHIKSLFCHSIIINAKIMIIFWIIVIFFNNDDKHILNTTIS